MTKRALALREIPKGVRSKLNLGDLKSLTGTLLVRDRVATFFQNVWQLEKQLLTWKRKNGFCGGLPNCMQYTGDGKTCNACKRAMQNPKHTNKRSEYGKLRMQQKKEEET